MIMGTFTFTCGLVSTCVSQACDCFHPCLKNAEYSCKDICLFVIHEVGTVALICITVLLAGWYIIKKIHESNVSKRKDEQEDAKKKRENEKVDREIRQKAMSDERKQKRIETLENIMIVYMDQIKEKNTIKDDPYIAKLEEMIKNTNNDHQEATVTGQS